ncbi:GNAT family N-acetyltransferase [Bacillus salitolerans]|uniref:GNAT family N-acetyltransferase n=1 Tax=Bacillus salitolerans TaxID=1437434 RepID=A0ABW4LVJ9_9BACI
MKILETDRLLLRWATEEDAAFILHLLNDPSWIEHLGDRGIKTIEQAKEYISSVLLGMYRKFGLGLYIVERKKENIPIGICGLIKRESLEDIDIGFAFSSDHQRNGYGFEAALATLKYARDHLGLQKIVAITSMKNTNSSKLLCKIGMEYERMVLLPHDKEELRLYKIEF